jgi:hypothetical protein
LKKESKRQREREKRKQGEERKGEKNDRGREWKNRIYLIHENGRLLQFTKNVLQGFLNESKKADILVYKKLTIFGLQKIDM